MDVDIEIKNYRCFGDPRPARLTLDRGFTAFVGANNSGKSSLLKFFYEFRDLFALLSQPTGNFSQALTGTPNPFRIQSTVVDHNEIFHNQNDRDLEVCIRFTPREDAPPSDAGVFPNRVDITVPRGTHHFTLGLKAEGIAVKWPSHDLSALHLSDNSLRIDNSAVVDLTPVYEAFKLMADTLYVGAFRNAINLGSNENYFDIQVGQKLIRSWKDLKSGSVKKHNEACYRLTQDIRRIFGYESLEINPSADEQTLQMFINGRSYKLSELGSGLAHFIVVLANVATRAPSYLLIDEPELGLHPSLQLEFLTTLASYCGRGVLFATHSVGLARAIAPHVYT
ncbi:MAG: AAA family ATPase, partial [Chloroflexi bacterium]|nr:AAA family ATPase [Chloroflexota bacterium]